MKVFATGKLIKPLTPELRQKYRPIEVAATIKLYLEGMIEQFWFRENVGPIFLMSARSVEEAEAAVNALPLTADGFVIYECTAVGPLTPLGIVMQYGQNT
ncbi:hypothetical protein PY650_34915 [Rhizobium calliandrae]|uniref:Uncharacterized protein n=1 Tax=Rhizobium calliandrae TaxID=1312182 RepID=A0ABT7KPX2_9HYPH|nr:hypothetical protein [Rhizobium calliandrae]MDL2410670.1 hypothetical protein [Rhizobium calliandrae]